MTLEEIDYRTLYDSEVHKNLELLDRIKELEEDMEKCCYEHKQELLARIKELEEKLKKQRIKSTVRVVDIG